LFVVIFLATNIDLNKHYINVTASI
jgi:hypothetical protein